MKCPSCKLKLCEMSAGGLRVFVCQEGCGGLWFGRFELLKLDNKSHGTGARLLNVPKADGVRFFRNVEAICPQCETSLLFRHFFSRERDVEVCQCAKCSGFWIDSGELSSLVKSGFETEEKQKQAVTAYFKTVFDQRIAKMNLHTEDVMESARSIVKIFLFICPKKFQPLETSLQQEYFGVL